VNVEGFGCRVLKVVPVLLGVHSGRFDLEVRVAATQSLDLPGESLLVIADKDDLITLSGGVRQTVKLDALTIDRDESFGLGIELHFL
jgi:hypothetical protein